MKNPARNTFFLSMRDNHSKHIFLDCSWIMLTFFLLVTVCSAKLSGQEMTRERKLALQTPEVFFNPGEAQYSGTKRMFQGVPAIERTHDGRLWVSFVSGCTGEGCSSNYVLLITSGDDGKTWSDLKVVVDMPGLPVRTHSPGLWIDPLGKLWFLWTQSYHGPPSWVHCGTWAMISDNPDDADPVWSEPRRLFEGTYINKPIVLSNSDWIFPNNLRQHLSGYTGEIKTETGKWKKVTEIPSTMTVMTMQGEDIVYRGMAETIDSTDFASASEHMIVELGDGRLWMLLRIRYGMGESFSNDGGRTWTPVEPSAIKHTASRFFFRKLRSGNLLLVKHGSLDKKTGRELLTAYISRDDGATWEGEMMLDERHPVSYPDGLQAPDGRIYVIYDHGRYPGTAREILMAVFTEEDVLAGRPSKNTHLRVVVSKSLEPECDQKVP
jgi:hypothetical protein